MAKLKPWYHVVTPREDLRENRPLDASEFAVHLDHIRQGRAHEDYIKPVRFFDRTYMTKALTELCTQVLRRLSGIKVETSAVFNMATQFGGGKTHALTALYHLASTGDAAKSWKGIDAILHKAELSTVPKADVAVFVGAEFDALKGRGGNGEPVRKTAWGEIAWQLDGERAYKVVEEHDRKAIAPGGDVIREMLPNGPALILMDEVLNYISRGCKLGLPPEFFNFLQNLSEETRAHDNVVLCVSIPASELEMNTEDQRDYEALKKLLDRVGKAIMMSAEMETAEIIRRRLFEWNGLNDDARRVVNEYADWAADNAVSLGSIDAASARDIFTASYPFHPSVLSVFERKWQSLPRFQRTRGILRLLALWVAYAHNEQHRRHGGAGDLLIGLGSAPIEDPNFRSAMFEQLGSSDLEGPVTTDIAGKRDAWAVRLDQEAKDDIKRMQLHQKVATTILFESSGGQTKTFATVPEIKTAVGSPDLILPEVDNVLETLSASCYYLSQDGNRYKYGTAPNLNKVLTDRRAGIHSAEIDQRLKKEIQTAFKVPKGFDADIGVRFWPEKSSDIPERPELSFVVLATDTPAGAKQTHDLMDTIVRECGSSGRTMKSALIFVAPAPDADLPSAVRNVLAWEAIEEDLETTSRLDDTQKMQLNKGLGRAKADLKEAIVRAYCYVYLLAKDSRLTEKPLGQLTSSMGGSMVEIIVNELVKDDDITDGVGANKLVKNWPPALTEWSTKAVRDAFYSSPLLPRLKKADAIKRTIADGVSQRTLGYARSAPDGRVILEKFDEPLSELDVEIADDVFILRAEDARKLLEPPKLAKLQLEPSYVSLKPGEKAAFVVKGLDQYGQPIEPGEVSWSATGGSVSADGQFTAGGDAGVFSVRARAAEIECPAQVRIGEKPEPGGEGDPPPPGKTLLEWSGAVPPQKWMNFYTKVLSRHASNPELKLKVTFEIPLDAKEADTQEHDARTALRDLGLDDDPLHRR